MWNGMIIRITAIGLTFAIDTDHAALRFDRCAVFTLIIAAVGQGITAGTTEFCATMCHIEERVDTLAIAHHLVGLTPMFALNCSTNFNTFKSRRAIPRLNGFDIRFYTVVGFHAFITADVQNIVLLNTWTVTAKAWW